MAFHEMTPAQARDFTAAWVGTWPDRRAWLEAEGGADLAPFDLSREFVDRLDAWAAPRVTATDDRSTDPRGVPAWAEHLPAAATFTAPGLWLVDAVALALGEAVIAGARGPGFRWTAGDYPRRRANYHLQNSPVVNKGEVGVDFGPLQRVVVWAQRVAKGEQPLGLAGLFDLGVDPDSF